MSLVGDVLRELDKKTLRSAALLLPQGQQDLRDLARGAARDSPPRRLEGTPTTVGQAARRASTVKLHVSSVPSDSWSMLTVVYGETSRPKEGT